MYHTIFHGYCIVCFVDCQSYSELVEVLKFVINSVTKRKCPPLMVSDVILTISSQGLPRQGGSLISPKQLTPMVTIYSCCKKLPNCRKALCVCTQRGVGKFLHLFRVRYWIFIFTSLVVETSFNSCLETLARLLSWLTALFSYLVI